MPAAYPPRTGGISASRSMENAVEAADGSDAFSASFSENMRMSAIFMKILFILYGDMPGMQSSFPFSIKVYHIIFPAAKSRNWLIPANFVAFLVKRGFAGRRTRRSHRQQQRVIVAPAEQPEPAMPRTGFKKLKYARQDGQQMVLPQVPRQIARGCRRQGTREMMTIKARQLIASVTTIAMATVKSVGPKASPRRAKRRIVRPGTPTAARTPAECKPEAPAGRSPAGDLWLVADEIPVEFLKSSARRERHDENTKRDGGGKRRR